MQYPAVVTREDDSLVVIFPDFVGCATQVDPGQDFDAIASECLTLCLEADLVMRRVPPVPRRHRVPKNGEIRHIRVSPLLAARVQLRQARSAAGLSQADLAALIGVTQQQVARLENPDNDLKISTLERAARALGLSLDINLVNDAA